MNIKTPLRSGRGDPSTSLWEKIQAVAAEPAEDFLTLLKVAALDPARDLRFQKWSGSSFRGCDLTGCDFTGTKLLNCDFTAAKLAGARFDGAILDNADGDADTRTNLRAAQDWEAYLANWRPPERAISDRYLPEGAVFQDAPFAPELVVVPSGRFMMGSPEDEEGRFDDEGPRHEVTIPERLAVGHYAVTFDEWDFANEAEDWQRVTGLEPRRPNDRDWGRDRRPVIDVSWEDAQSYIAWLRRKTGHDYRLLSEAEWEYCCRAVSKTRYSFGDDVERLRDSGWYGENSGNTTHPVGGKKPNDWGLYDMHGNVWEWCGDVWHDSYDGKPSALNETGGVWATGDSSVCVVRGGSWVYDANKLRSAVRAWVEINDRSNGLGFRIARTLTS